MKSIRASSYQKREKQLLFITNLEDAEALKRSQTKPQRSRL
jgi:hypothetical protein